MTDLLTLLGADTHLKRRASTDGGEWAGACPFCGGEDRFRVWPNPPDGKPHYWCRQCGKRGDAIQYLRDMHGLSFAEACERLGHPGKSRKIHAEPAPKHPEGCNPPAPPARNSKPAPPADWQREAGAVLNECIGILFGPRGAKALEYLCCRGLTEATIWRARLGYNPRRRRVGNVWLEQGIVIPWRMGPDLWALNVRRWNHKPLTKPKYLALPGSVKALYGASHLSGASVAFVCEGELDALLLQQEVAHKLPIGAVAVGGTAGIHDDAIPYLLPCRRILVCGDNDEPGEAFARRWAGLSERVRVVKVPEGYHDLTDFYQKGGRLRDWAEFNLARLEVKA